jgi:hypothetical protein
MTHPEYVAATLVFYKRHFCRTDPWPGQSVKPPLSWRFKAWTCT